jgi:DNA modification methylase
VSDHRVILGDCLDPVSGLASLPDKSVDHVITDPPYEAEAHSKGRRILRGSSATRANPGAGIATKAIPYPPITEAERAEVGRQIARVCSGWALVFCQSEAMHLWRASVEAGGARWVRGGVYRKLNYQPQYSGDRPAVGWEAIAILWCGPGRPAWNGGGRAAVWEAATEARAGQPLAHDGMKPLALMEALVRDFTDIGDLIADPFAGAGTTLVAAKRLGRRAIGWERVETTAAIAEKRIASAREQFGLWTGAA